MIAFDVDARNVIWEFPWRARKLESVNAMTPVVDGDSIFISESYGPGAVLLRNSGDKPEVVWSDESRREKALEVHWNTPVLHDGMLYACSGQHKNDAVVRCVEMKSGKIRWSQKGFARASLTYIDGHLIVLDEEGELFLIKATPEEFDIVTSYSDQNAMPLKVSPPCWAAPIIAHGLLYVRSRNQLFCFDLIP